MTGNIPARATPVEAPAPSSAEGFPVDDLYAGCRAAWRAGRCPCCSGVLEDWTWGEVTHQPAAVAEGVVFCGRCIGQRHHLDLPLFLPQLLKALVE